MIFFKLTLAVAFSSICHGLLEEKFISFSPQQGAVEIQHAAIVQDAADPIGVHIATESLANDFFEITGKRNPIVNISLPIQNSTLLRGQQLDSAIIVGTVESSLVKSLEQTRKVNVSDIRGKWETFKTISLSNPIPGVKSALLIIGSDKRGTIFGVHTLAEQSGQSPLHWWNDVPAAKHDKIYALAKTTIHGEPSVKYRGLFINDEAPSLMGWWDKKQKNSNTPLNTEFYAHVFDLMLRLKSNYMWPAMWGSFVPKPGRMFFRDDPRNHQLADDYGIIVGTSHHEPMQRASNEWKLENAGAWNWLKNKANITKYMEDGAKRAGTKDSIFTMGMRGEDDAPIVAEDPPAVLKDIFATQKQILDKQYRNISRPVQQWTVYKEVLTYWSNGLRPDEDITVVFSDDNWGNVARLPLDNETSRTGGFGMYFHLSYVGRPKSWKWQNANNLPKVLKELQQSYFRGADRIWMMNVGDIKPLELPFALTMDLAWNISSIDFDTLPSYLNSFAARDFGDKYAEEIGSILFTHSHLLGLRKFEMLEPTTYSFLNFHEAERVLGAWKGISDRAETLSKQLDSKYRATFHHLVRYPVAAGYNYHKILIGQGKNRKYAFERRNAANQLALDVLEDFENDLDMIDEYDKISDGKWAGIMSTAKFDMSTADWRPTSRDVLANLSFVQQRQDFDVGFGNLGIFAEQSMSAYNQAKICASINPALPTLQGLSPVLPQFTPFGPQNRTIELFHRGDHRKVLGWALKSPYPWIKIPATSGKLSRTSPEQSLPISIDWASVPVNFNQTVQIRVDWEPAPYFDFINVPISNLLPPSGFKGFPEVQGYISIEGPHFQRSSSDNTNGSVGFKHIPYLGTRSDTGSLALRPFKAARAQREAAKAAYVDYDIYVFSNTSTSWNATVYVNSALDTDPSLPMEFSLTLDSAPANFTRVLGMPATAGDNPPGWNANVADGVWKNDVGFGAVSPGKHTLRWKATSPEVYLEKVVFHRGIVASYLGPPETKLVG